MIKIVTLLLTLFVTSPTSARTSEVQQMLAAAAPTVVMLEDDTATGSGVVVGPDIVLTCAHVVYHRVGRAVVHSGGRTIPQGVLLKIDTKTDLALIHVPGLKMNAAKLATTDPLEFEQVYGVGFPGGYARVAAPELVTSLTWRPGRWLLSGAISHGDSGGGVFNEDGELVCLMATTFIDDVPTTAIGACIARSAIDAFLLGSK